MKFPFLFVDAKKIPYRALLFSEKVEELYFDSLERGDIVSYFREIEERVKKGLFAVGYFSYETGYLLEKRLSLLFRRPTLPLSRFAFFKKVKSLKLFPLKKKPSFEVTGLHFNLSYEEYEKAIHQIKDYIARGDTYQVNFTGKFRFYLKGNPLKLFLFSLFSQRCEYAFFLPFRDFLILSFSPELFLQKKGKYLFSSPMKGTAKRAPLLKEDRKEKIFLKSDEKTRAVNIMIVDLIRNDLGKVSIRGSVMVKELFKVKTYPTLHQMISTIQGTLEEENLFKIFKALFPCGSVTGAPKIRTMEIIRELEKEARGVYTGAIGYITPKGDFLFNVAIRTLFLKPLENTSQKHFYQGELGVGAGIVWDSDPKKEYEETLLKGRFFTHPLPYFELFETIRWEKENPLLPLHYRRLLNSAKFFSFTIPKELKNFESFKGFLEDSLKIYQTPLRVKVLLKPYGKLEIFADERAPLCWGTPIKVLILRRKTPKNLFHLHKTTVREEYEEARKRALQLGFSEVIFYNEKSELLEGSISNLFLKKGKKFLTPPLSLGILPGVLRESLLKRGLCEEAILRLEDLEKGELYLGNALRGLGKVKDWVILEDLKNL